MLTTPSPGHLVQLSLIFAKNPTEQINSPLGEHPGASQGLVSPDRHLESVWNPCHHIPTHLPSCLPTSRRRRGGGLPAFLCCQSISYSAVWLGLCWGAVEVALQGKLTLRFFFYGHLMALGQEGGKWFRCCVGGRPGSKYRSHSLWHRSKLSFSQQI